MTPAAWLRLLLHPLAGQHPKNQQSFGDPVGWHVISINYLFFYFWLCPLFCWEEAFFNELLCYLDSICGCTLTEVICNAPEVEAVFY